MINEMNKGLPSKQMISKDSRLSSSMGLEMIDNNANNTIAINHETIFIPYYSVSKQSKIDNQMNYLITYLGKNGKKKGIRS